MHQFNYLVGKPKAKIQHERIRDTCRWEDTIKIYITEVGCQYVPSVHQAEERGHWWNLLKIEMKLKYP
jgi:hypothetical protein